MHRFFKAGLLVLVTLVSCQRPVGTGRDTIELVKYIAGSSNSPEHVMLASFSKVPSSGDICIIGGPESCGLVSEAFLTCDIIENARGRQWSDGLKDFAGECFACFVDDAYFPYAKLDPRSIRELSVRYALAALSNSCNVSKYDLEGKKEKTPAKMLLLADPMLLVNGKFDIDTLFSMTGCRVPVFSPTELLFNAALGGEKKYFNLGILCDTLYLDKGVYPAVFGAKTHEFDIVGANYFESSSRTLAGFLDDYAAAGRAAPLEALLIDDWNVDLESMENELAAMRDLTREDYMRYGKYLAPDFKIIASLPLTMTTCYTTLRSGNLFTHRIAQPVARYFSISPRPDAGDMQFLLIPADNVQN